MRLVLCFVALLAVAVSASGNDKSDEASIPLFEPTDDWKEVLPGQHIPGVSNDVELWVEVLQHSL